MNKTLFITDLHFGIYQDINLLEYQFETLTRLINEEDPKAVIIGGDIFHYRNPRASTLIKVKNFFDKFNDINWIVMRGNHDTISKSGSIETTLDLVFTKPNMKVIKECTEIDDIWFLPHYEDIQVVETWVKDRKYDPLIAFGHFAYKGERIHPDAYVGDCIDPQLFWNMPESHLFLGHIHHPSDVKNIHCVGTQYSVSFGESNEEKRYLVIEEGGNVKFKPMKYGIKHLQGTLEEVEKLIEENPNFKLLTRVKIDSMDAIYQQDIKEAIAEKENVLLCDIRVLEQVITPKKNSLENDIFSITDDVIDEYIGNNPDEDIADIDLKQSYEDIIDEVNQDTNP